jgi:hypothetical protein
MNHWSDSEQIIKRGARAKAVRRRGATAVAGAEGWEAATTAIRAVCGKERTAGRGFHGRISGKASGRWQQRRCRLSRRGWG